IPVMGHAGEGWPTRREIRYTRCRLPEESLLGGRGAGFALAQERLGPAGLHHCRRWIVLADPPCELLCHLAADKGSRLGHQLAAFLRAQGLPAEELSQQQFPKGHSNLTYLVGAGGREFVLRRPPVGSKVRSAHDMGREARILLKLQPVFPLAPRVVAVCDDVSVLGAPFYLMERVRGVILRGPEPRGVDLNPLQAREIGLSFARTL